jgi:hypothetical protein
MVIYFHGGGKRRIIFWLLLMNRLLQDGHWLVEKLTKRLSICLLSTCLDLYDTKRDGYFLVQQKLFGFQLNIVLRLSINFLSGLMMHVK